MVASIAFASAAHGTWVPVKGARACAESVSGMFGRAAGKQKRSEEELAELEEEEERERQEEAMEVVGEMQLTAEQLKASLLRCNWHCIFCMLDIMCRTKVHGSCAMPKCGGWGLFVSWQVGPSLRTMQRKKHSTHGIGVKRPGRYASCADDKCAGHPCWCA